MSATTTLATVDADGHILEHGTDMPEYFEPPWATRARSVSSLSLLVPTDGFDRDLFGRFTASGGNTRSSWLQAMELGELDMTILYPSLGLHLGHTRDPDFAIAYCRAYNDWMSAEVCDAEGRIRAVALLPPQDPGEAAAELTRAVALPGMVGAILPADGPFLLGGRAFDVVYEAAARLGTSVAVHGGMANLGPGVELFPKLIQAHTIAHPFGIMRQFTSMMFEGVFARYPDVRFAFLETGATWVPWLLDRMDEEYSRRGDVEAPRLPTAPSTQVGPDRNVFFGLEADERMLAATLDVLGSEIFMYASDWPHWDHEYPESIRTMRARNDLDERQRADLCGRAALRYYAIDAAC